MNDNVNDKIEIEKVIRLYFESMFECDGDKARQAFHPNAKIVGYTRGELQEMTVEYFASYVESQTPSARDKGEAERLEVISIDIAGETAVARVRDDFLSITFLDTLSFIKIDGKWSIYNKLYHVEKIPKGH